MRELCGIVATLLKLHPPTLVVRSCGHAVKILQLLPLVLQVVPLVGKNVPRDRMLARVKAIRPSLGASGAVIAVFAIIAARQPDRQVHTHLLMISLT